MFLQQATWEDVCPRSSYFQQFAEVEIFGKSFSKISNENGNRNLAGKCYNCFEDVVAIITGVSSENNCQIPRNCRRHSRFNR